MHKIILLTVICFFTFLTSIAGGTEPESKQERKKNNKKTARPDIPGMLLIDLGFNVLQNNTNTPFDLELLGSRTANFYYQYDIRLKTSKFFLLPGIGLGLDHYKFDEDITLSRQADNQVTVDTIVGGGVKKSLLVANYLDIPLEIRFFSNPQDKKRSFKVGLGFKAGVLLNAHTKIKQNVNGALTKRKHKDDFALNRFRYGITGRLGVGGVSLFYYQNLDTLFEPDRGSLSTDASTITIGLSINGF